jgi:bifunctional N-acetylglucosamine-1-phosphate-uridyltransferase/glucosamine-1-phosphate-acetyltransferase GlmU-like protein
MTDKKLNISVVIAAAGKGTRSKLSYPKCLFRIQGKEILATIMDNTFSIDSKPTLIVSFQGLPHIEEFLTKSNRQAEIVVQNQQLGMGHAVLQISEREHLMHDDILLSWGDLPFIPQSIFEDLSRFHFKNKNDFSLATYYSKNAYTYVIRDNKNQLKEVIESREIPDNDPSPVEGERDIGIFLFKKKLLLDLLNQELPNKFGQVSNEHGFLYIIKYLASNGYRVQSLPVNDPMAEISFNSHEDIEHFL